MDKEVSAPLLEEYIAAKISFSQHRIELMKQSSEVLENAYKLRNLYACRRMLETMQNDIEMALGAIEGAITLQRFVDCPQDIRTFISNQKELDKRREEKRS